MTFKVIIAGDRDLEPAQEHYEKINKLLSNYIYENSQCQLEFLDVELVTGMCRGADQIPYHYRDWYDVPIKEFPADWATYDRAAGPIRNQEMAEYADALIAFDAGGSGTADMIRRAEKEGLKVRVIKI